MGRGSEARFTPAEWAAIATVILVWGLNNGAAKYATAYLPPFLVGGVRFVVALAFLAPFIRPPFPPWRQLLPVVVLTGPLHFGVLYCAFGLSHNLSLLGIILQLWIPLSAVFAWWLLGEAMSPAVIAGVGAALAGAAIMTFEPSAHAEIASAGLGVLASIFWGLGTVLVRRLPGARPLQIQGLVSLLAAPILLGISFAAEPHALAAARVAPAGAWVAIAFGGIGSTLGASALLFWLVQRHETGRVTGYMLSTPLVTCLLGVLVFGDVLTPRLLAGGALTMAGVGLVALSERRRMKLAAAALSTPT
jgi:O-acetylserine/cysteine efflux transporter